MFEPSQLMLARLVGLLLLGVGLVSLLRLGGLLTDPWALPRWRRQLRPATAILAGILLWMLPGLAGPPPGGAELECVDHDQGIAAGAEAGVPILVDFTADWCTACRQLKREVLDHPRVVQRAEEGEFICVVVDVTVEGEHELELMERYGVFSLPRIALVDAGGEWVPDWSMSGMVSVDEVLTAIRAVAAGEEGQPGRFEQAMMSHGIAWALLLVFLAGFASSLTPCVYPLIPITVGLFAAAGASSRLEGLGKATVFVAGIAVTYSALGMVAALAGGLVGGVLQSRLVLALFALFFLLFGMASLGVISVRLPAPLQARLGGWSGRGGLVPLFLAGLASGVLAAPCVGPILAGVLVFVAETRQVLLGGTLMFVFALGLGVLFLFLGTFSSLVDRLPKSGAWMEGVKGLFAVVFCALAVEYAAIAVPAIRDLQTAVLPLLVR
ncbi:MAG: hypothetical protein EA398_04420 [Deltaproteobacteria bacterium]|nr:MAG: hypothetical protein EA398_04420 [Deltaproteobacteria bacterium]